MRSFRRGSAPCAGSSAPRPPAIASALDRGDRRSAVAVTASPPPPPPFPMPARGGQTQTSVRGRFPEVFGWLIDDDATGEVWARRRETTTKRRELASARSRRDGKDAENLSAREPARRFVRTSTADTTSVSVAPSTSCVSFVGFESDSKKSSVQLSKCMRSHLPRLGELVRHEYYAARGPRADRPRCPPGEQRLRTALLGDHRQLREDPSFWVHRRRPSARSSRPVHGNTPREIFRHVADLNPGLHDVQRGGQRRGRGTRAHTGDEVDAKRVAERERRSRRRSPSKIHAMPSRPRPLRWTLRRPARPAPAASGHPSTSPPRASTPPSKARPWRAWAPPPSTAVALRSLPSRFYSRWYRRRVSDACPTRVRPSRGRREPLPQPRHGPRGVPPFVHPVTAHGSSLSGPSGSDCFHRLRSRSHQI